MVITAHMMPLLGFGKGEVKLYTPDLSYIKLVSEASGRGIDDLREF